MNAASARPASVLLLVPILAILVLPAAAASSGPEGGRLPPPDLARAPAAPPWAVGSAWTWTVDQEITFSDAYAGFDVVVNHVAGSMTDQLAGLASYNGTPSYRVEGGYALTLTGNYTAGFVKYPFSWPVTGNGTTYYRVPDLATVRAVVHLAADLGVIGSTTFDSTADASPPAENFRFPLDVGSLWAVSTNYTTWDKTTGALGSAENNNVTRVDYDARVPKTEEVVVPAGMLPCFNITYAGTSSTDGGSPRPYNDSALYCEAATNLALRRFTPLANLTVVFGLSAYALNHAPSVVTPLPAVSFDQGTTGSLDLSTVFADPDAGDALTFSASNNTRLAVTFSSGIANFKADAGWTGAETVVFAAADQKGARAEAPITVAVTPLSGNHNPPVATCSTHLLSMVRGSEISVALSQRFTDPDIPNGDTLTFSVRGLPANFTVALDPATGLLRIRPPADYSGTAQFVAEATDSTGLNASETIRLSVVAPDQPPRLLGSLPAGNALTLPENSSQDFTVDAVDPEGSAVTVSWTLDGSAYASGRNVSYAPAFGTAGAHDLTASISDGKLSILRSWSITVTHTNRPPEGVAIASPEAGALVTRGQKVSFAATGRDPDNDALSFTWKDNGGRFLGTGPNFELGNLTKGNHLITLEVSDGNATVTATTLLTVKAPSPGSAPGYSAIVLLAAAAAVALLARKNRKD